MSLIKLNTEAEQTVTSVSATTKPQQANAAILFGKNATVILKRLDELVKIKELDTSKLEAILDLLKDAAATEAYAKKAAGKSLVTAVRNLYKAKTLVATINALRAIKIKPTATNAVASTGKRGAAKQISAVDQSAIGDVTVAGLRKMTHAQRVAFTNKLVHILGLEELTYGIDNRGESFKSKPGDEWEMEGHVGQLGVHLTFDDPYNGKSKGKWILSLNTGVDDKSFAFDDFEGIKAAINKNHGKTPKNTEADVFSPAYSTLRTQRADEYAPKFIRAVEPKAGQGVLVKAGRSNFQFTYQKLNISVSMLQKGWAMVFEAPHLKAPRTVQIHLGELQSVKNVIELMNKKDPNQLEANAAIKKGLRKL